MSIYASDRSRSKAPLLIALLVIVVAVLGAGVWYLRPRFETDPPQVNLSPNADAVGLAPLELNVADKGAGLKSVTVTLSQGSTEHALASEQFSQPVAEKKITVALAKV